MGIHNIYESSRLSPDADMASRLSFDALLPDFCFIGRRLQGREYAPELCE